MGFITLVLILTILEFCLAWKQWQDRPLLSLFEKFSFSMTVMFGVLGLMTTLLLTVQYVTQG